MNDIKPRVLALDLEGVLISNAVSQFPRPHLFSFLDEARKLFERVVMFTTVREPVFREIAKVLVAEQQAPQWFADIEFTTWHGKQKDLRFVPGVMVSEVLLVDDMEAYVLPEQLSQWIPVKGFDPVSPNDDDELLKVLDVLKQAIRPTSP